MNDAQIEGLATTMMNRVYGTPPSADQLKELSHGALWRLDQGDTRGREFTPVGTAMIVAALMARPQITDAEFRDLCLMLAAWTIEELKHD